jgi:lysophospholipase L1-like esterase
VIQPEYVFIQYGYLDGSTDPDRRTTIEEFKENLRTIVQMVLGFKGVPVLVTLHAARYFDSQGHPIPIWQDRIEVTREVAAEFKTPLIDLNKSSLALLDELGPDGSAFMQLWADDLWHVTPLGAHYLARLVVNDAPPSLGPYLQGIFELPPKP